LFVPYKITASLAPPCWPASKLWHNFQTKIPPKTLRSKTQISTYFFVVAVIVIKKIKLKFFCFLPPAGTAPAASPYYFSLRSKDYINHIQN